METVLLASASAPKLTSSNSTLLKDAGLFYHTLHPHPVIRHTFKKSATARNCVAVGSTHIYAAQAEKAVVHVYHRERGSQEAVVSFPQRLHSAVLTADDSLVVLGTEGGGLILWETFTGRQTSTPASHLGPVVALAVDVNANFVLSGSNDSTVNVWSLVDLLNLPASSTLTQVEARTPRRTLSGHRQPITGIAIGHSASTSNIAVTASKDKTVAVWNYHTGQQLRVILLPTEPLSLALDIADRALFVGLEDGSVQMVDFFELARHGGLHPQSAGTPVEPSPSLRLMPSSVSKTPIGAALCLAPTYDGTTIISGHESGKVVSWDIGSRRLKTTVADYIGAPITNLHIHAPTGLALCTPHTIRQSSIIKPKPHDVVSGPKGGILSTTYAVTGQFPKHIASQRSASAHATSYERNFDEQVMSQAFDESTLRYSVAELASWSPGSARGRSTPLVEGRGQKDSEFVSLDVPAAPRDSSDEEVKNLRDQVSHLRRLQALSNDHIERLLRGDRQ